MTRTDHNVALKRVRALGALLMAAGGIACSEATGSEPPVDLEITFENTISLIYWVEFGPQTPPSEGRFFLYQNASRIDTIASVTAGYGLNVEISTPGLSPGAPSQTWATSCTLGSTGYKARAATVRVEIEGNVPSVKCIDW